MSKVSKKKSSKSKYDVNKKSLVLMITFLILLVILVIGVSYQVYFYTTEGKSLIRHIFGQDSDVIRNGTATVFYKEGPDFITLGDTVPMTDEQGMALDEPSQYMDFTVDLSMKKNRRINYEVVVMKDPSSTLDEKYIRVYLQRISEDSIYSFAPVSFQSGIDENGKSNNEMIIEKMTSDINHGYTYRLRVWIDSNYPLDDVSRNFKLRVKVRANGELMKK